MSAVIANNYDANDKRWNKMGDHMQQFHNYFRLEFREIYDLADCYEKKGRMTLSAYLRHARGLYEHLNMHHGIEERFVFPMLATRMPEFKKGTGDHIKQHEIIHDGLVRYNAYLNSCASAPSKYQPEELRSIMSSFEKVLFSHLDEEVETLMGPNMSKYWTLDEIIRMRIMGTPSATPLIRVQSHIINLPTSGLPECLLQLVMLQSQMMIYVGQNGAPARLAGDWSVAMPGDTSSSNMPPATSLAMSSTSDISLSMTRRFARRFKQPVFISIDLPFLNASSVGEEVAGRWALMLEKSIVDHVKAALAESVQSLQQTKQEMSTPHMSLQGEMVGR